MPQPPTISETRTALKKMEDEELARKRAINAKLRQEAVAAADARNKAPKSTPAPEAEVPKSTPAPEFSEEEEIKKTFRYLK
jgi:hypothetical protein